MEPKFALVQSSAIVFRNSSVKSQNTVTMSLRHRDFSLRGPKRNAEMHAFRTHTYTETSVRMHIVKCGCVCTYMGVENCNRDVANKRNLDLARNTSRKTRKWYYISHNVRIRVVIGIALIASVFYHKSLFS